jgi:hypothetical protein
MKKPIKGGGANHLVNETIEKITAFKKQLLSNMAHFCTVLRPDTTYTKQQALPFSRRRHKFSVSSDADVVPAQFQTEINLQRDMDVTDRLCSLVVRVPGYRSRVRFPALPNFLRSSGSGTGSTQSREYN